MHTPITVTGKSHAAGERRSHVTVPTLVAVTRAIPLSHQPYRWMLVSSESGDNAYSDRADSCGSFELQRNDGT